MHHISNNCASDVAVSASRVCVSSAARMCAHSCEPYVGDDDDDDDGGVCGKSRHGSHTRMLRSCVSSCVYDASCVSRSVMMLSHTLCVCGADSAASSCSRSCIVCVSVLRCCNSNCVASCSVCVCSCSRCCACVSVLMSSCCASMLSLFFFIFSCV